MLILAGVSINLVLGENGLIKRAQEAALKTEEATKNEQDYFDYIAGEIDSLVDSQKDQFNETENVNKPKLSDGMIPVKYNGTNWVICSEDDAEWYDYENKEWANVMLSDGKYKEGVTATVGTQVADADLGSMFVWIPRYAYSITKYKTQVGSASAGEGTTQNITNVTFLVGITNEDKDGNTYATDYNTDDAKVGEATPKIVHPAFTFGGERLTGIWSAKFEASMAETNNNTVADNNVTTKTVKIVPNAESWRYIQVGKCFTNCLNMKSNSIYGISNSADTHLMKNNEWGAITYLTVSQYGQTPTKNVSGTKYGTVNELDQYHSYSAEGDYKTNVSQSTTGNITGIYDMNGGAWEFVAAYWDNGNGNLSGQGTSTYFENNKLKEEYTKYWDKYEVSQEEINQMNAGLWNKDNTYNNIRKSITDDRYNLMKDIKGDALYEVINTYSYYGKKTDGNYEWGMDLSYSSGQYGRTYYNDDYALIGNISLPFLRRGGDWWTGPRAGVFASHGNYGNASYGSGFRLVVVVL